MYNNKTRTVPDPRIKIATSSTKQKHIRNGFELKTIFKLKCNRTVWMERNSLVQGATVMVHIIYRYSNKFEAFHQLPPVRPQSANRATTAKDINYM